MARSIYLSLLEMLRRNDVRSFKEILDKRGLPQEDHFYDYELLMRALRLSRKTIVNYLLDKKCHVNRPPHLRLSNNPLHIAVVKLGWCSIVEKMLRLKARVTDIDDDGNTPLHLAFLNKRSDRVINSLLSSYINESTEDISNEDGLNVMHIACASANYDSFKELFHLGMSDINSQVSLISDSIYAGYSPLHFAVENGKHRIVKFLCKHHADIYARDLYGSTPIHLALEKRDSLMLDILLSYDNRNQNYVNVYGASHFMAACAGSHFSIVDSYIRIAEQKSESSLRTMVDSRIKDISHYPNAGYTPMHFACEHGNRDILRQLLMVGSGLQCLILTTYGLTPHNLAVKERHWDICYLIEQYYIANQRTVRFLSDILINQQEPLDAYYMTRRQHVAQVRECDLLDYYRNSQIA